MKGIDFFNKMIVDDIPIDNQTIISAIKACSSVGDIKTANTALQIMKER